MKETHGRRLRAPCREDRIDLRRALALKKEMVKRHEIDETLADLVHPAAGWRVATRMTKSEAVNFLNQPPPTLPGEASVTNRPDGTVDIYWYGRPSSL